MTGHETVHATKIDYSPEEKALLNIESIDQWRATQDAVLSDMRDSAEFGDDYGKEFSDTVDDFLNTYLSDSGLTDDSANREDVRNLYRAASIDTIHDDVWFSRPTSRGEIVSPENDKSEREKVIEQVRTMVGSNTDTESGEEPTREEAIEQARLEVEQALGRSRDEMARVAAKRQGRLFGKSMEYSSTHVAYDAKVREFGKLKFQDEIDRQDEMTDDEKTILNAKVVEYLLGEQKALREKTVENLRGTRTGRFIEKFGGWLNKGGKKTRIVKGIGLSMAVGAAVGATVGTGGLLFAAAGLAGIKGYASRDRHHRGMNELTDDVLPDAMHTLGAEELLNQGQNVLADHFEQDTKEQQKERRKSTYMGVGMAGVALGTGLFAHYGIDAIHHHLSGGHTTPSHNTSPGSGSKVPPSHQYPGSNVTLPKSGEIHPGSIFNLSPQPIAPGEGWYQVMQNMGVDHSKWAGVLQKAGPELIKHGYAYHMSPSLGSYGLLLNNGSLPPEALQILSSYAS